MNVTSVLSKGYLEPARRVSTAAGAETSASVSLAAQEQQILAQERMLKMTSGSGAQVSTTYRYTTGPDGRRYITGAEVTIQGDEDAVDRVGGGVKRPVPNPASNPASDEAKPDEETAAEKKGNEETSAALAGEDPNSDAIRELKQIEREVVSHEAAHQAAGGRFAGAVSYTYTQGPDGHAYITGGEVPIHVPPSSDPEQAVRDMEQVQRAALAPASPSGQDRSVAAQAAAAAAQARQQIAASGSRTQNTQRTKQTENASHAEPDALKTGISSVQAELLRDRVQSDLQPQPDLQLDLQPELAQDGTAQADVWEDMKEAYARAASPLDLWTPERGFEAHSEEGQPSEFPFEIAA
jgi:hypothetical protein